MRHTLAGLAGGSLLLAVAAPLAAQVPAEARAVGMGGAYTAVARGYEAVFLNPANLGLGDNPEWSVSFPQLSFGGTLLGPTTADLPDIVQFDGLERARRDEILAAIPASGTEVRYDFHAPLATWQRGGLGLGVAYGSVGQHTVSRDLVELLFNGYEEGRTDYKAGNTAGSRATYFDFAAAYGRAFGPLSLGVTGHYVRGGTVMRSRMFEPRIDLEAEDIEVDYVGVLARGGQGYGVDVGAAYQPSPSFTLSGSVTNLYATMEWTEKLSTRRLTLNRAEIDDLQAMDMLTRYRGSEQPLDATAAPSEAYVTAEGLYEDAYFPAIAHLGALWQPARGTQLAANYQKKLTEGRLTDRWEKQAGVGISQKLPLLSVQAGYATNLDGASMLTGGLTLGPLQLSAAKLDDGDFAAAPRTGWVFSMGLGVKQFAPGAR